MGLGEGSEDWLNFDQAKNLCQYLYNYTDTVTAVKVSHTVYVIHMTVLLKMWATVALVGTSEVKEKLIHIDKLNPCSFAWLSEMKVNFFLMTSSGNREQHLKD